MSSNSEHVTIDGKLVEKSLGNALFGHIITLHERVALELDGRTYFLRVIDLAMEQIEEPDESDVSALETDDPYRGRIIPGMMLTNQAMMFNSHLLSRHEDVCN